MSQQRSTASAAPRGMDEQTQVTIALAFLGMIGLFIATPPAVVVAFVAAVTVAIILDRGVAHPNHVALAWAAPLWTLALDWHGALAALTATRDDFRAAFGPATLQVHWYWLRSALEFGLTAGMPAGRVLALAWDRKAQRAGTRRGKPIAARARDAAKVEQIRETQRSEATVALGHDDRRRVIGFPFSQLSGHASVFGATGSGKTTALLVVIEAALRRKQPVVYIDLKGDPELARRLRVLSDRNGLRFRQWSFDGPECWNPLLRGNPTVLKDKLIGMEDFTEPHYKRAAERHLQLVCGWFYKSYRECPTLARVVDLLDVGQFQAVIKLLPETDRAPLFDYLDALTRDQLSAIAGLRNRLALLTESEAGRWLREQEGEGIDLGTSFTEGEVVLFSLNSSLYGEAAAQLGGLVLQEIKAVVGHRLAGDGATRGLVVVDEFSALAGDHVLSLLARARSSGVAVVLATQELADLSRVDIGFRDQVLGNTTIKIVMRQEVPESAELFAQMAGTRRVVDRTRQVDEFGLLVARTGLGSEREVEEFVVHPNEIRRLGCGEAVLIHNASGRAATRLRIVPVQFDADGDGREL